MRIFLFSILFVMFGVVGIGGGSENTDIFAACLPFATLGKSNEILVASGSLTQKAEGSYAIGNLTIAIPPNDELNKQLSMHNTATITVESPNPASRAIGDIQIEGVVTQTGGAMARPFTSITFLLGGLKITIVNNPCSAREMFYQRNYPTILRLHFPSTS